MKKPAKKKPAKFVQLLAMTVPSECYESMFALDEVGAVWRLTGIDDYRDPPNQNEWRAIETGRAKAE